MSNGENFNNWQNKQYSQSAMTHEYPPASPEMASVSKGIAWNFWGTVILLILILLGGLLLVCLGLSDVPEEPAIAVAVFYCIISVLLYTIVMIVSSCMLFKAPNYVVPSGKGLLIGSWILYMPGIIILSIGSLSSGAMQAAGASQNEIMGACLASALGQGILYIGDLLFVLFLWRLCQTTVPQKTNLAIIVFVGYLISAISGVASSFEPVLYIISLPVSIICGLICLCLLWQMKSSMTKRYLPQY